MNENARALKDAVKWFIISEELITKKALVLAAVSGGADSMALLSILDGLSAELNFRLAVAHFDHRLRPGSDKDRAVVEQYARSLGLSFYASEEDVRAAAEAGGDTLEEAARKARYRFLTALADEIGAAHLAVGHTRQDHIETILMRIIRGTGIRGLCGIPTRRGKIIRPLMNLSREDTHTYCQGMSIPSVIDSSNLDKRFFRNRIRLELIPHLIESYNPGLEDNLLRLAKNAGDVVKTIRIKTNPLVQKHLKKQSVNEWVLNFSKISPLDETSLFVLFSDIFAEELQCDMDFSRVHYEQITGLIKNVRGSGKMLTLPGLVLKREFENLIIIRQGSAVTVDENLKYKTSLIVPGITKAPGLMVRTEILDTPGGNEDRYKSSGKTAFFALTQLKLPLVLRNPLAGDRMQPFGMSGKKKLSDIFIDKKIPGRERSRSLVVADAKEILWLVGVTTSESSRIDPQTERIVKISVERE
jgi:tRNA(Ile)-lysidine synthase